MYECESVFECGLSSNWTKQNCYERKFNMDKIPYCRYLLKLCYVARAISKHRQFWWNVFVLHFWYDMHVFFNRFYVVLNFFLLFTYKIPYRWIYIPIFKQKQIPLPILSSSSVQLWKFRWTQITSYIFRYILLILSV